MQFGQLLLYYLLWHYGKAFLDISRVSRNFLWFLYNFFSISFLLRTLFSPLERLHETYRGDFNIGEFFAVITVNILMRIVGAVLRLFVIIFGTIFLLVAFILSILFFVLWVVLPPLVPILFFGGFAVLFT